MQALHALAVTDARLLASDADIGRMSETLAPYLKWTEEGGDDAARRRGAEQLLCVLYIQVSLMTFSQYFFCSLEAVRACNPLAGS